MFNNSLLKDKPIVRYGRWTTEGWEWVFSWKREWFECQKPMQENFMACLSQQTLHPYREDKWLLRDPY